MFVVMEIFPVMGEAPVLMATLPEASNLESPVLITIFPLLPSLPAAVDKVTFPLVEWLLEPDAKIKEPPRPSPAPPFKNILDPWPPCKPRPPTIATAPDATPEESPERIVTLPEVDELAVASNREPLDAVAEVPLEPEITTTDPPLPSLEEPPVKVTFPPNKPPEPLLKRKSPPAAE